MNLRCPHFRFSGHDAGGGSGLCPGGPPPEEARQAKKDLPRIERQMMKASSQAEKIF